MDGTSDVTRQATSEKEVSGCDALHPLEAEYCRARFMVASLKVTAGPSFTSMVADWKGKVLGLGAPPAREIRVGGDRCCSSASCGDKTTLSHVRIVVRVTG